MAEKYICSTEPEAYDYIDINVPCQGACPAFTNIPGYIRNLFEERYGDSYEINHQANILPGVLGRICSRPCEEVCRHGEAELGHPVDICHIKRAAADYRKKGPLSHAALKVTTDRSVAIVGSGPAALAAAHDLALIGIPVTIFEALPEPGGMLRFGIPAFRLPRHVLNEEIDEILGLGITLKTGIKIGADVTVEKLLDDFDAALIASGCYISNRLNVPGENLSGVYSGLEMMMDFNSDKITAVGDRVLVIGAGFTAFDCARAAIRMGAEDVTICLRRTEESLAVTEDEILETKMEGVKINALMLSRRFLGDRHVEGVEFVRTRPGDRRSDGKEEISPIEGSEFIIPADSVIVATGQGQEPIPSSGKTNEQGVLNTDKESGVTSVPGLYITGDYLTGPSTVIEAVAQGRESAENISRYLMGRGFHEKVVRMKEARITDRQRSWDFIPRQELPTLMPVEDRFKKRDLEVETGYSLEQAREESKRCYLCYLHYEIDISRCIYCRYCIDVAPRDCIKLVNEIKTNEARAITGFVETSAWKDVNAIVIDNSRCIRCGECMRVCPVDCISVTRVELVEKMLKAEESHV